MYQFNWETLVTNDYLQIINHIQKANPDFVCLDTETDGLNIVNSKPFLLIISFFDNTNQKAYAYCLEYEPNGCQSLLNQISMCKHLVGFNIKYDLHMLRNGGSPYPFNNNQLIVDCKVLRRLTNFADSELELNSLKFLATKYVDANASSSETQIKELLRTIKFKNEALLTAALKPYGYNTAKIKKVLKDFRLGLSSLDVEVRNIYLQWLNQKGEPTYKDVYLEHPNEMVQYAVLDGIYTLEVYANLVNQFNQIVAKYPQVATVFYNECKLIPIYYHQEMVGFNVDIEYLQTSKIKVIEYIKRLEALLHKVMGQQVSENQHKVLIEILKTKFNVPAGLFDDKGKECFNKAVILRLLKTDGVVKEIVQIIQKLRTARKWLKTYIEKMLNEALENKDHRLHPISDQAGTVSGRISSPFQQVPKDSLLDENGNELYSPRKAIIPSKNGYSHLVFQDFDQMELRVQADYTILFDCLDENMCTMFIPYKHTYNGKLYDVNDSWCKANYNLKDANNNSIWTSNSIPWINIDPHGLLVKNAFNINENHPDWKHYRNAAKRINFAMTYGSGLKNLLENPDLEDYSNDIITKIYNAYKTSYKGIVQYQQQVMTYVSKNGAIQNRYGRVYRFNNVERAYKACNYLIQGTCADLVKFVINEIYNVLQQHQCKSRILFTIHDEIVWELYDGEEWLIAKFKEIIDNQTHWSKIPLTCGTDITKTNWAEKQEVKESI